MAKIIEAEYQVTSFWEPKNIDGWPLDEDGYCREIETAAQWWIKDDMLFVIWDACALGQVAMSYPPTHEAEGVCDFKRADKIYVGAEESTLHRVEQVQ